MTQHKHSDCTIGPKAIRAQLKQILASDAFARARRMQRFLEYVVEETLAGRADQLGEFAIGIAVFDRGEDFEPALDPIVRNDARRLRVKLAEYYAGCHAREAGLLIDMPKGGYVPRFLPAAPVEEAEGAPDHRRRLAVLPFEAICATQDGMVFGHRLCMSLTAGLTNVDGIEAVAHGYVRLDSVRDSVAGLQLTHVISGAVWNTGGRYGVTVNLIHATHGTQIWAKEYEFGGGEMPRVFPEITARVVREVKSRLAGSSSPARFLAIAA